MPDAQPAPQRARLRTDVTAADLGSMVAMGRAEAPPEPSPEPPPPPALNPFLEPAEPPPTEGA